MGNIAQNYNAATVLEQEAELYFASSVHAYTANLNNEIGGILENTGINTWQDIDTTLNSIFDKLWEYQQKVEQVLIGMTLKGCLKMQKCSFR